MAQSSDWGLQGTAGPRTGGERDHHNGGLGGEHGEKTGVQYGGTVASQSRGAHTLVCLVSSWLLLSGAERTALAAAVVLNGGAGAS